MALGMFCIVPTFFFQRLIEKTTLKLFFGICTVLILTVFIVLNICPLIICVDALHKQVDEADTLCSKSHVIVIIIAHMHD